MCDDNAEDYPKSKSCSFHGIAYELYLHVIFIYRCMLNKYAFKLSTQSNDADKFDDAVCEINRNETIYCRMLQAKHAQNNEKAITKDMLLGGKNTQFALPKYFVSYLNIVDRLRSGSFNSAKSSSLPKQLLDLIIFTNIGCCKELHKDYFEECTAEEELLNFPGSKRLRLKYPNPKLDPNLVQCLKQTYLRHVLAKQLVKSVKSEETLNLLHDVHVTSYLKRLDIVEMVEVSEKSAQCKFKPSFFQNAKSKDSKDFQEIKEFRTLFLELYESKPIDEIPVESLKKALQIKQFHIAKDFYQQSCAMMEILEDDWPQNYSGCARLADFFAKLKFFVNQPDQQQLHNIITQMNVSELFQGSLLDNMFARNGVEDCVIKWMARQTGQFVTQNDTKRFFSQLDLQLKKLVAVNVSQDYKHTVSARNVQFEPEAVQKLRLDCLANVSCIECNSLPLTMAKIVQFLHQRNAIVLHSEASEFDFKCSVSALEYSSNGDANGDANGDRNRDRDEITLVIELCDSHVEKARAILKQLPEKVLNGKVVFVVKKDSKLLRQLHAKFLKIKTLTDDADQFSDLTAESRQQALSLRTVMFQGSEIASEELLLNENTVNHIRGDALWSMAIGELSVGRNVHEQTDVDRYYIERKFEQRLPIVDKNDLSKERFYVTTNLDETHWPLAQIEGKDVVVISENDYGLDANIVPNNVHWLTKERNQCVWTRTKGRLTKLRTHFAKNTKDANITQHIPDKKVIIAAEPGMGKTTLFNHLLRALKTRDPACWLLKISLIHHIESLRNLPFQEDDDIFYFLFKAANIGDPFERALLKAEMATRGRIALFFDGYDEVDAEARANVVRLLEKISARLKTEQLWISTRLHLKENLENELGLIAYSLCDLNELEQEDFLVRFWMEDEEQRPFYTKRAKDLIQLVRKSMSSEERQFMGIPLQTRMVAEVYEDHRQLPRTIDILSLYEAFIDKKYAVLTAKMGLARNTLHSETVLGNFREKFDYAYEVAAINALYPSEAFLWLNHTPEPDVSNDSFPLTGLISDIVNGAPQFIHRTFAEFFAARWLARNWRSVHVCNYLTDNYFRQHFNVVRHFFERLSLPNRESGRLLRAVLNNLPDLVQELLEECEPEECKAMVNRCDDFGRTPLHLARLHRFDEVEKVLENYHPHAVMLNLLFLPRPETPVENEEKTRIGAAIDSKTTDEALYKALTGDRKVASNAPIFFEALMRSQKPNQDALSSAIQAYNFELVRQLLQMGVSAHAKDSSRRRPLFVACQSGNFDTVELLLANIPDSNCYEYLAGVRTVFHVLFYRGLLDDLFKILELLLRRFGFLVNMKTYTLKDESTLAHLAATNRQWFVVRHLVARSWCSVNSYDLCLNTVLLHAVVAGNLTEVAELVAQGAEVACVLNATILRRIRMQWDVLVFLVQAAGKYSSGADVKILVSHEGESWRSHVADETSVRLDIPISMAMKLAIAENEWDRYDLLVTTSSEPLKLQPVKVEGADLWRVYLNNHLHIDWERMITGDDMASGASETPLLRQYELPNTYLRNLSIFQVLTKHGSTPLHYAAKFVTNEADLRFVTEVFKDDPTLLQIYDTNGLTPLHCYIIYNTNPTCTAMSFLLTAQNVNSKTRNKFAQSPLSLSIKRHLHYNLIMELLNKGADVVAEPYIVHDIISEGLECELVQEVVRRMGSRSAGVVALNRENQHGLTPLMLVAKASTNNFKELVSWLIMFGADVNYQNREFGNTALHEAVRFFDADVVRFFIEKGADPSLANHDGKMPVDLLQEAALLAVPKLFTKSPATS